MSDMGVDKIPCDGCGAIRVWRGSDCITPCACVTHEEPVIEFPIIELEKVKAERDRYRDAIEKIMLVQAGEGNPQYFSARMYDIAKQALEGR